MAVCETWNLTTPDVQHPDRVSRLTVLANQALCLWAIPKYASARLINISENATFLVEAPNGYKSILRIHRKNYHTRNAIACEHAWSEALNEEGGVKTAGIIAGKDGERIQIGSLEGSSGDRYMVMFEYIEGEEPNQDHDLVTHFEELGAIAARSHIHAINWQRPQNFQRLVWDINTVFGPQATWGDWREAPFVTTEIKIMLEKLQSVIVDRLTDYGKGRERYGLIHADMRLANLLINKGETRLIDFDDCGLGWFMYDFAAGISFMEDHPQVPALKRAWVKGYRTIRQLNSEDEKEMDTLVMLRRMALLAWIGTHSEVDTAQDLAPTFASVTAELAEECLSNLA